MDTLTKSVVDQLNREVHVPPGGARHAYDITHGEAALAIIELLRDRGYYSDGSMARELAVCVLFLGSLVATPPRGDGAVVDADEVLTAVCRLASLVADKVMKGQARG